MRHSHIAMTPVASTTIAAVGYDPDAQTMHVEFNNGKTYQYSDVPPDEHEELMRAQSIGKHFGQRIRNSYVAEQVG